MLILRCTTVHHSPSHAEVQLARWGDRPGACRSVSIFCMFHGRAALSCTVRRGTSQPYAALWSCVPQEATVCEPYISACHAWCTVTQSVATADAPNGVTARLCDRHHILHYFPLGMRRAANAALIRGFLGLFCGAVLFAPLGPGVTLLSDELISVRDLRRLPGPKRSREVWTPRR